MAMRMLLDDARQLGDAIWEVELPPHEVQLLGSPKSTHGARSVILVDQVRFDEVQKSVQFDASSVSVLNLGTSGKAVLLDATHTNGRTNKETTASTKESASSYGPGDQEFIRLVKNSLREEARGAALDILSEVRKRWPGDLKRGKRSNFKNTPDNFWYVIVQPRVQALSITVRGDVSRFTSDRLELKADRPGYTRFALTCRAEVSEALGVIEQSKRKQG